MINERIKQLAEQATIRGEEYLPGCAGHPTPTVYFDKEKFAELIVRECMKVASPSYMSTSEDSVYYVEQAIDRIAEHFGVEE